MLNTTNLEDFIDTIRDHKQEHLRKIKISLELDPLKNRMQILKELSKVANRIITATQIFIEQQLHREFGYPSYLNSYQQHDPSHLAILAMGKLAEQRMNYFSDLDLIFIYSHRGETRGKKIIDNAEYFVKFAQRFINTLSVLTSHGRCYEIDTELRPSGNTGALVSSYDGFLDHQMNKSQNWERMALLRCRPIDQANDFIPKLKEQIQHILFKRELDKNFATEMATIRKRVIAERSKEHHDQIDIKLGEGSIMDIEFIAHHLQLHLARIHPELRQTLATDELLTVLKAANALSQAQFASLHESYILFRTLESFAHLKKNRSTSILRFDSEEFDEYANLLHLSKSELESLILEHRKSITAIFNETYHDKNK